MLEISTYKKIVLLIAHIALGVLIMSPVASKIISSLLIIYALIDVVNYKNKDNRALMWVCYFISAEVLFRMTKGLISWELIKYVSGILIVTGAIVDKATFKIPANFLIYILLMLLGIVFTEVPYDASIRKSIVFNLSGPILLGVSAIIFYKKEVRLETIYGGLFYALLPIFSMVVYLYFHTPSITEIRFGGAANFSASGGFGPNQVSTALGFGIFALGVLLIAKKQVTGFVVLDLLLFVYMVYRCLLTFSRGGLITGTFALIVFALFYAFSNKNMLTLLAKYLIFSILLLVATWVYTSAITGGMLTNRYLGQNASGEQKEDITSGRANIMEAQFESFMEHPFVGIGVGNGKYKRQNSDERIVAAAHNEVGRIIEEHGLIGLLSLFLLLSVPILNLKNQSTISKGFTLAFYLLWFLTINHSAMRIALPSIVYGLSLINIVKDEES